MMARLLLALLAFLAAVPATAQPAAEKAIRATVAHWYDELGKKEKGRAFSLTAPGFIDAAPHYRHANNGSAKLGPRVYTSLAATALRFRYEVQAIRAVSTDLTIVATGACGGGVAGLVNLDARAFDDPHLVAQALVDQLLRLVDQRDLEGDGGDFLDPEQDVLEGKPRIELG